MRDNSTPIAYVNHKVILNLIYVIKRSRRMMSHQICISVTHTPSTHNIEGD